MGPAERGKCALGRGLRLTFWLGSRLVCCCAGLQGAEGEGFVGLVVVQQGAEVWIDRADEIEKQGVEMFVGGEAYWDRRGGLKVENETMWHKGYTVNKFTYSIWRSELSA